MPKVPRPRREPTDEWQQIKQYTLWPEQEVYELLRPIILWGTTPAERAKETGAAERTLRRKASAFDRLGMASLFPHEQTPPPEHARRLTPAMRQLLIELKTEYPGFSLRELATICFVRFGRQPSHHTVKQVLAASPLAPPTHRRYPPYAEIADPFERRRAVVQLHAEGWSVTSIAAYLHTNRARVYEVLQRWISEGWAGLEDHSRAPKSPARKVTFEAITQVRKLASNQALGAFRVRAALEQLGISLSQATCGRLLALNRALYGLDTPKGHAPKQRREMPFKARFRHEWWSVDVRYIEDHQLPDHPRPVYQLTILENYSRCVLASKLSHTQNQWDYLEVLFEALSTAGIPKGIVSDGGAIFASTQALEAYRALGIRKERIEPGAAWQNYIETLFNIARRMADIRYAQATSWAEIVTIHQRWVNDYNTQRHLAHEHRQDGCHSPKAVLGWHKGTVYPEQVLNRILFATRFTRHLNQYGYLRFQHWQLYGKEGLAERPVTVWMHDGTLKVEYQAVTLSEYEVELHPDRKHLRAVNAARLAETPFRSPQLTLWEVSATEWRLFWHLPDLAHRRRTGKAAHLIQPSLFEVPTPVEVAGSESPRPRLHLLPQERDTEPQTTG